MNPQIVIHDAITGQTIKREMTDEELKSFIEPKSSELPNVEGQP